MIHSDNNIADEIVEIVEKVLSHKYNAFLNIEECAKFIGISKNSLYAMTSKKEIPFYKIGKRILFERSEIHEWITINFKIKTAEELNKEIKTSCLTKRIIKKDGK